MGGLIGLEFPFPSAAAPATAPASASALDVAAATCGTASASYSTSEATTTSNARSGHADSSFQSNGNVRVVVGVDPAAFWGGVERRQSESKGDEVCRD